MIKRRNLLKSLIILIAITLLPKVSLSKTRSSTKLGENAPDFKLTGFYKRQPKKNIWSLQDFRGLWLVIYFYPKDFTSGCTLEAKGFQNKINKFRKNNCQIVGISADSQEQHESFCNSQQLDYILLSDSLGKVSKDYDSWSEPYSKRNTYIIDPEGIIKKKWIGVKPLNHANEVLESIKEFQNL
tara:strand:+ start:3396 stop:3947 length:552 start_codon:yes stop_codon:yes gene_type:complete